VRAARVLRRELDLWVVVWQQIDTFLQRIDGARDQDGPHRRKLEALLGAAGVVERQRALTSPSRSLSAPVVDALPTESVGPASGKTESLAPAAAWSPDLRDWRVPGTDEIELAVGMVAMDDGDEPKLRDEVLLRSSRPVFSRPVGDDGQLELLSLPSYPGGPAAPIVGIGGMQPRIKADPGGADSNAPDDVVSMFSVARRKQAASSSALPLLLEDAGPDDQQEDPVVAWSRLCADRRGRRPGSGVKLTGLPAAAPPSGLGLAQEASSVVSGLRSGTLSAADARATLQRLSSSARAMASAGSADAAVLRGAADVLDQEGCSRLSLPDELRAAADFVAAQPAALRELANAADELRPALSSATRRQRLEDAAAALSRGPAQPLLLASPVEAGPMQADLDAAASARVIYPDGTLRILRALEMGFLGGWSAWLRWFKVRNAALLVPLTARFQAPFLSGLRALVHGGDTGLPCEGLEVQQDVPVGGDTVITAQPASLRASLDAVEPGHVGVVAGDRPAALVVLGLDQRAGRLALNIAPLRVSVSPDSPGSPGVLAGGQPIGSGAPGLSAGELRSGEAGAGPAADGLVHEAVALWSRLCLVFGSQAVERGLQGSSAGLASPTIPDPSSAPLEALALHGQIPVRAASLVITGAGDAYWDRSEDEPQPRIARHGELLLLRGRAEAEGDQAEGRMVQAAVEVERVFRVTGSMLDRMDLSTAGRLSTAPLELGADSAPVLICGPEEDVIVVLLRRTWMDKTLVAGVSLRRDFAGFDLPSLATQRLLPLDFLAKVLPHPQTQLPEVPGVDRAAEFGAALETFKDWMRYASNE
jgi:hypothetical protein